MTGDDGDAEEALREAKERLAERLQVWTPRGLPICNRWNPMEYDGARELQRD